MNQFIPVNRPAITDEDAEAVADALRAGWVSGDAPLVGQFEEVFAASIGRKFGIAVPNGSIAIDLVIGAMNIGPGDEVIVPSFAIISCVAEVIRRGATPVFVDAEPSTWNMDVASLEALISPRTRLIIAVHIYGLPVDMSPLIALAERHRIPVLEDAAEAHGLSYRDQKCGSFGLVSTFSFYANKNVTTGEGGIVCTDDQDLAKKLRYLRNLAFEPERRFVHHDLGWNYRFTAIQAALGLSQLKRLPSVVSRRREIAHRYMARLEGIDGVSFQPEYLDYAENGFWVVGVTLDSRKFGGSGKTQADLAARGVGTRPFFFPLHKQPVYLASTVFHEQILPTAERLGEEGVYFPNGIGLSDEEISNSIERVAEYLTSF